MKNKIGVFFMIFPTAGNNGKNIFIMKNEKKKKKGGAEIGNLLLPNLYCERGIVS